MVAESNFELKQLETSTIKMLPKYTSCFSLAKLGRKTNVRNLQQVIQVGHKITTLPFLPKPLISDFADNWIGPLNPWDCPLLDIVAATVEVVSRRLS